MYAKLQSMPNQLTVNNRFSLVQKTFEKEIQNYYYNHLKTIENEHKEKLSTIEAKDL